jgi:hypothetical protein
VGLTVDDSRSVAVVSVGSWWQLLYFRLQVSVVVHDGVKGEVSSFEQVRLNPRPQGISLSYQTLMLEDGEDEEEKDAWTESRRR